MIYAMADIHGCYDMYIKMLSKIGFSDIDSLFILGDVLDRGDNPVKVLTDMSMRGNVFPILGNHEYISLVCLKCLSVEITEENYARQIDANALLNLSHWLSDGGQPALDGFKRLTIEEKQFLIEYMEDFPLYETLKLGGTEAVCADLKKFTVRST